MRSIVFQFILLSEHSNILQFAQRLISDSLYEI